MRLSHGNRGYYTATVLLDGKEIYDFEWADDERGEVMVRGPDGPGDQTMKTGLCKGKVEIKLQ